MELFISLAILLLIAMFIQVMLLRSRMKDKKLIETDWEAFNTAVINGKDDQILEVGNRLVWNKYLQKDQLLEMIEIVNHRKTENEKYEKLSLDLLNKQVDYERTLPEPGSSGGINQSW